MGWISMGFTQKAIESDDRGRIQRPRRRDLKKAKPIDMRQTLTLECIVYEITVEILSFAEANARFGGQMPLVEDGVARCAQRGPVGD